MVGQTATLTTEVGDFHAILLGLPGATHGVPGVPGVSWLDPTGPLVAVAMGISATDETTVSLPYPAGAYPGLPLSWLAFTFRTSTGLSISNPNTTILR